MLGRLPGVIVVFSPKMRSRNAFGCWQQTKSRLFGEKERLSSTNLPFAFSSVSLRNAFEAICDFGDSPLRCLGE